MQFDDCTYFKAKFGTTECMNVYDNEIRLIIPWRSTNFYKMVNGEKINVPVRNFMKDPTVIKSIQQLSIQQLTTVGEIEIALHLVMVIDAKLVWYLKLLRLIYFQERQQSIKPICVTIRLTLMHLCTKINGEYSLLSLYSFRTQNQRTFFQNQVSLISGARQAFSNCAGCYQFDDQTQIVYSPIYTESIISYSETIRNKFYWLQTRIRDQVTETAYFDILSAKSQYDLFPEFQTVQNKVILNQFSMFIAKPEQYSKKKPKFQMNYYNLLESTICQPQQFNQELTTLLFQCGFTMMYYQIDGGKYCVMNKMLNFTEPQTCTVGNNQIQLDQIPGSGVYTVTFLSNDYQKFLNQEQYSNCFLFMKDLNDYLTKLKTELDIKTEYYNDDIYFDKLINTTQQINETYPVKKIYELNNQGIIINFLVIISIIGIVITQAFQQ
ncbi:Conserved_hypothetical protein [Hexamita inflata]|uniref:Transmembrane protein n=1 Tax=Hexamita inflata TaxID=28002 RepID=A0AA86UL05_9EUKA|nr:Conserved hypothetical protein [Hexamita inflata]